MWLLFSGNRSSKTFKPKKNIPEGSHQYELLKHAEATLGSGNLRAAVMLPEGEDLNEWIAVNSECVWLCVSVSVCVRNTWSNHDHATESSPVYFSCGLLQPDQHAVRNHHWVLHRNQLLCHVCRTQVHTCVYMCITIYNNSNTAALSCLQVQ